MTSRNNIYLNLIALIFLGFTLGTASAYGLSGYCLTEYGGGGHPAPQRWSAAGCCIGAGTPNCSLKGCMGGGLANFLVPDRWEDDPGPAQNVATPPCRRAQAGSGLAVAPAGNRNIPTCPPLYILNLSIVV